MHPIVRGTGLTLVFMLGGATIAGAQEANAPRLYDTTATHWVYASYHQVPWSRVDSLLKLERFRPAWRARAIAMGCFVDSQLLIHQTGNEYNVVNSRTYSSYRDFGPGGQQSGCAARAWRETIPDSTLRTSIARGRAWVYGDVAHYDVIYWVPYPRRR
ncbi:MAG TPA: hypothetical protein VMM77_12010 [Gemmatimonadaceae bacterium]|nr:hypothetical protein [Gemmatimonadaceae bacterium]